MRSVSVEAVLGNEKTTVLEPVDYQLQIRDEGVNWLVELGRPLVGTEEHPDEALYERLHDAIRSAMDLQKFAASVAADPQLAEALWPQEDD